MSLLHNVEVTSGDLITNHPELLIIPSLQLFHPVPCLSLPGQ